MLLIVDFSKTSDKERLHKALKGLKPVPYLIELKVDRDTRSNRQNKYYWGVVLNILSEHTGFTPEEMNEYLKGLVLNYTKDLPNGGYADLVRSTKDLDTKEMEEFLEKVRRFSAQELDCQIPEPNELIEI
jgi:ribosomal protein L39E